MRVFRFLLILVVLIALLNRIFNWGFGNSFIYVAVVAELSLISIVVFSIVKAVKDFIKNPLAKLDKWESAKNALIGASVSSRIAEILIGEIRIFVAFFYAITFRPVQNNGAIQMNHPLVGSMYPKFIGALLFVILLEIPAMHFIVQLLMNEGPLRSSVQFVFLAFAAYAIVWVIGEYRLIQESKGFYFGEGFFRINLGIRADAIISFDFVESIEKSLPPTPPLGKFSVKEADILQVNLLEKPNVLVTFKSPQIVHFIFGFKKAAKFLRLCVPDPDAFLNDFKFQKDAFANLYSEL